MRNLVFFLLIVVAAKAGAAETAEWLRHAERLTGESEAVRERAIRRLKNVPGLEGQLTIALTGPDRFLAVDVIATLKLKNLLPLLIDLSRIDDTGTTYLAMNALMDKDNAPLLTKLYKDRLLANPPPALAARMVIIDTFGRIGFQLAAQELNQLYSRGIYEVKSAVVAYARLRLRAGVGIEAHSEFLKAALKSPYQQLRLQALYAIKDLPSAQQSPWRERLETCVGDRQEKVRELCLTVRNSLD
ncbi:MAG: hypothetical protein KDD51_09720 [Bdellovibrionales bacterium]|nr:hypothetical protein [Bdellovibrionales bacterium]